MIVVGYKVDFHAFVLVAFWEWPANSIGPLVSLRSPLFYTPNLSSAIRIWMAIARKHKNLLSVTQHHNYDHYLVFMPLFRLPIPISFTRSLVRFCFIIFECLVVIISTFYDCDCDGKQKPWNYSIKSSNSVNANSTHTYMILLHVLKMKKKKKREFVNANEHNQTASAFVSVK